MKPACEVERFEWDSYEQWDEAQKKLPYEERERMYPGRGIKRIRILGENWDDALASIEWADKYFMSVRITLPGGHTFIAEACGGDETTGLSLEEHDE